MTGESDLAILLSDMRPFLHDEEYVFCSLDAASFTSLPFEPLGTFREAEGITIITTRPQAVALQLDFDSVWACITLMVHSSLNAIGFLAAITQELAQAEISVNAISAYYHDHLFVPWEARKQALEILGNLSGG